MTSKIRIKVGSAEIEFEGSEDYMRQDLPALLERLYELSPSPDTDEEEEGEVLPPSDDPSKKKLELTTNTIANKLGATTGPDLALAACAHLCLVKGRDSFSRANILGEMKLANNFYKKSYGGNLSKILRSLVSDSKILETAQDTYALNATEKANLEKQLTS